MCNKEFPGGYDELVELNNATIDTSIEDMKAAIQKDIEIELHERLKKAFIGNKYFKL